MARLIGIVAVAEKVFEAILECFLFFDHTALFHEHLDVVYGGVGVAFALQYARIEQVIECAVDGGGVVAVTVARMCKLLLHKVPEHGRLHEPLQKQPVRLRCMRFDEQFFLN